MDDKVDDMDIVDQHQVFSVYEPHYQQMHPLIFYEDASGHHHHHHPHQLHHHHHHHAGLAALSHHHWDHEHFGVREICVDGDLKSESDNRGEDGNDDEEDDTNNNRDNNSNDDNINKSNDNGYDENGRNNRTAPNQPVEVKRETVIHTPSNRELHNEIERRRRLRIKQCCDILRTLVPGLSDKTDKATVLEHTVKFVSHLAKCPTFRCDCEF